MNAFLSIVNTVFNDLAALAKAVLKSRCPSGIDIANKSGAAGESRSVIVMGNGPSLRKVLAEDMDLLMSDDHDRMAVNFAANAPEFFELKPQHYTLADPHFFDGISSDGNVARLWENLGSGDWEMSLWVPADRKRDKTLRELLKRNGKITPRYYNLTPSDGSGPIVRKLTDMGLVMPRPRNVLIPAIMNAIRAGYKEIIIVGADHSWSRSLWVDDENRVVSLQPHFYKDNEKELKRVAEEYAGYHLHDILNSLTIAFRSYFEIAEIARRKGVRVLNATEGSFIDAFERIRLK